MRSGWYILAAVPLGIAGRFLETALTQNVQDVFCNGVNFTSEVAEVAPNSHSDLLGRYHVLTVPTCPSPKSHPLQK